MLSKEESVDVKALRARFINNTSTSDTSSRDSGSPKSPRPGFGRATLPVTEMDQAHHRLSPNVLPPPPSLVRLPGAETLASSPRPPSAPRLPHSPGVRASIQSPDASKVKLKGELLQNMMLRHQNPLGTKPAVTPAIAPAQAPARTPTSAPQPRPRGNKGEVIPLRRPLPPEGPQPLKPKRPQSVNLEPFVRMIHRGAAPPVLKKSSQDSAGRNMSLPTVITPPPNLPHRANKPSSLPRQIASVCMDDNQETYDDIGSFERNESWSDNSLPCINGDDNDEVYEFIDLDQVDVNKANVEKINKKEAKKLREQEKKEKMEHQKREKVLKKNFQLKGEIEVLHTAKVRHDWYGGGKLDLGVQQGESVEILRVKNNPGGKWLARSLNGTYGYISNTCVDIDYEAVKRKVLQSKKMETSPLPPPPPDPPQMLNMNASDRDSFSQDEDDYDDVQPATQDFPPPPPEISINPKTESEMRKKFKYEGQLRVLHTMMVDPNSIIKRPGGKDLHVSPGEVLDIIQLTSSKKALCCNRFGKYGYVSRSLLLSMEGDIYDDVDYPNDVYDNDSP